MKNKIITIPNLLSLFRLLLIPLLIWLYLFRGDNTWAIAVLALSALTDIVDGFIARRFNMISDLGKILDPIADKLTQAAVLLMIALRFVPVRFLLGFLVVKELTLGIVGLLVVRRTGVVTGAHWHGKLCTVVIFAVMAAHMIFSNMASEVSVVLVCAAAAIMILSLTLYLTEDFKMLKNAKA